MVIRPVREDDRESWKRMREALWPSNRTPSRAESDEHANAIALYFEGKLQEPAQVLVACDEDGRIVGMVELSIRGYAEGCETDRVAYLEGWYVDPQVRGQGVGAALVQASEAWGRSQGCTELASDTEVDNFESAAAHRAVGFKETGVIRCFKKMISSRTPTEMFTLRHATPEDVPELELLIAASVRALSKNDYTDAQIDAALGTAFGVDSELIRDGTYFVAEANGEILGSGGWSRRRTLFGGDAQSGRQSELLDPAREAARIRAFFVRPDWARHGIGRALLERCEMEAGSNGFHSLELMATLPGVRLYRSCGYTAAEPIEHPLRNNIRITLVPMAKRLR